MANFFKDFFKKKELVKIEPIFFEFSPIGNDKTPVQPFFRFNPNAYDDNGPFKASDAPCDVCTRESVWISQVVVPDISVCARCIANNDLGRFINKRHFILVGDITLSAALDEEIKSELFLNTPCVSSYNPFEWQVLEGIPMAFVGYGEDKGLWKIPNAVRAMQAAWEEFYPDTVLDGPTSYLMVFKEVEGEKYTAIIDLD